MHEELIKLEKYGFESCKDRGMQIALKGGKIYKSPDEIPRTRIHALYTGGDKVKIHFDHTVKGKHVSSTSISEFKEFLLFMDYVDGKIKKPQSKFLEKYLANLPKTTIIKKYKTPKRTFKQQLCTLCRLVISWFRGKI